MLEDGSINNDLPRLLWKPEDVHTQSFDSQQYLNEVMDQIATEDNSPVMGQLLTEEDAINTNI